MKFKSILFGLVVLFSTQFAHADSPVVYYPFDEGTISGKVGKAQEFNGVNEKVTVGNDVIGSSDVTVSAWIYVKGSGRQAIVSNGQFIFGIRGNGTELEYRAANNTLSTSAVGSIVPNTWLFVTVTRTGKTVNFYINGQLSGSQNQINDTPVPGSTLYIGGRASDLFFDGYIDDLRIYNRVLDASEIIALYGGIVIVAPPIIIPPTPPQQTTPIAPVNGVYTIPTQFSTIQACADVVKQGETCLVDGGSYDERVTIAHSGTSGNPIIFAGRNGAKLRGFSILNQNYIVIKNFEITRQGFTTANDVLPSIYLVATNNIQILDNIIHHGFDACIKMRSSTSSDASNNALIKGNTLSYCGRLSTANPGRGVTLYGNNHLVENNDISHLGVSFTNSYGGDFNVIRNNYFHDNSIDNDWGPNNPYHLDGFADQPGVSTVGSHHILVENNFLYNAPDHDSKFVLFQEQGSPGSSDAVIRYNTVQKLGNSFLINNSNFKKVRIYNNTSVDLGIAKSPLKDWTTADFTNGASGGKLINNIFYNVARNGGNLYSVDSTAIAGFYANNNLGFNSECGTACTWFNPANGISKEMNAIINKDPMFQNPSNNFNLQSSSPAIDSGGALTRVSASDMGSGLTLTVDDAGFFQNGWAGVSPDWISIGYPGNMAQIVSIDYVTDTMILNSPLSRKSGDSVYLYKDSTGRQVFRGNFPDIGAYEYAGSVTVQPTLFASGDLNKDGFVNSIDLSIMAGVWNQNTSVYDLNNDGIVNTLDYAIMVKNWSRE